MDDLQTKTLCVKRFGWRRIARDRMCFGWQMTDAQEERTVTEKTTYEVDERIGGYTVTPRVSRSTKIRVWLSLCRRRSDFLNLGSIFVLELFYNIFFTVRRLLGLLLPLFALVTLVFALAETILTGGQVFLTLVYALLISLAVWAVLILLETVLARIALKILKPAF